MAPRRGGRPRRLGTGQTNNAVSPDASGSLDPLAANASIEGESSLTSEPSPVPPPSPAVPLATSPGVSPNRRPSKSGIASLPRHRSPALGPDAGTAAGTLPTDRRTSVTRRNVGDVAAAAQELFATHVQVSTEEQAKPSESDDRGGDEAQHQMEATESGLTLPVVTDMTPSSEALEATTAFLEETQEIPQVKTEDTAELASPVTGRLAVKIDPSKLVPLVDKTLESVAQAMGDLSQIWSMLIDASEGQDPFGGEYPMEAVLRARERLTAPGTGAVAEEGRPVEMGQPPMLVTVTSPPPEIEEPQLVQRPRRYPAAELSGVSSPGLTPTLVRSPSPTEARTAKSLPVRRRRELPTLEQLAGRLPKRAKIVVSTGPGGEIIRRDRQDPSFLNVRECPDCGKRASSSRSQTGIIYYYCRNPACPRGRSDQKFVGWTKS